jgi:hypothetical protein
MIYIGVDPGVKTGYAEWCTDKKKLLTVETKNIITAMSEITMILCTRKDVKLIIEDARIKKFHLDHSQSRAQGVGSIKRDCKVWEEFCNFHNIEVQFVIPNKRITKLNKDQFKKITGWDKRSSEHARDAAMLVFGK